MKPRPWATVGGLVLLLGMMASCEQPTVDPDEKYRDLLVSTPWGPDPAYPDDPPAPVLIFYRNGTTQIGSGFHGTWAYDGGVLTMKRTEDGLTDETRRPELVISTGKLHIQYVGVLRHLIPFTDK